METTDFYLASGLLAQLPVLLKEKAPAYRYALITDSVVNELYGKTLLHALREAGLTVELFTFPAGEKYKNEATKQMLDHALLEANFGRDSVILALGGGVVSDLAGFVAATYLRGIPYVTIPTTVLAMVDSSIGGKVGVDTAFGKNMLGTFWHPKLILADTDTLSTLSETERTNGWFEALKMFLTMDPLYYEKAKKGFDVHLLERAIQLKMNIVEEDELELSSRSILNFGHSVGHALEKLSDYELPHGFAVALGILLETRVSVELGHLDASHWDNLLQDFLKLNVDLNMFKRISIDSLWEAMQNDKKNRGEKAKIVLLKSLGTVLQNNGSFTHSISKYELESAYSFLLNY